MRAAHLRWIALASFVLPGSTDEARAFLARDRPVVESTITFNPADGPPIVGCTDSETVEGYTTKRWRFAFDAASPGAAPFRCESTTGAAAIAPMTGTPAEFGLELTVRMSLESQMEGERVLVLKLSWPARAAAVPGVAMAVSLPTVHERTFYFSDEAEAFVPISVGAAGSSDAAGRTGATGSGAASSFREIVLGVRVTARPAATALYGSIEILSAAKGATVFLDGGPVTATATGDALVVRNLPPGLREVVVRDPAGTTTKRRVTIWPERTVLVDAGATGPAAGAGVGALRPRGPNDRGFDEFLRTVDGMVVVRIPAGESSMGNVKTERSPREHRVRLAEFLMDKTAVTWRQFKRFAAAVGIPLPRQTPYWGIHDDHPAVYVTWEEAKAYCEWSGGRLPTEAEREKAARGTDLRKYPWGDEEPTPDRGIFRNTWGYAATGPVGTHPAGASPYGLHDTGGNVWEWCADWYADEYDPAWPEFDPRGPVSGRAHVVRGGSWDSRPTVLSASCRNWGHRGYREGDFGFRCAMNSPAASAPLPQGQAGAVRGAPEESTPRLAPQALRARTR